MVLLKNFRVFSCTHDNLDRYRGYKQIQVILIFQILFTASFGLITSRRSTKIPALFATIQVKSSKITKKKKKIKISNIMSYRRWCRTN